MTMTSRLAPAGLVALGLASALAAQTTPTPAPAPVTDTRPSMADKLINIPSSTWNVYGTTQSNQRFDRDGPQGYPAVRVNISKKGATPYEVGGISPITKPIAAGDVILVAVYLRAPNLKDGETTPVPMVGATRSSAPYDLIASGEVAVSNQWQLYYGAGKAPAAFAPGEAQVSVQLSAAKHVVDLGPVRVFDFGPDFDLNRLPKK